ncbi:MAG: DNA repair protein RadA [Oscillospiraceae bacterium]
MNGLKSVYVCSGCGSETSKWFGRCPSCGEWNSLVEEIVQKKTTSSNNISKASGHIVTKSLDSIVLDDEIRFTTGISELDRVLGGGVVKGSVVLIGGEPGAGKSTLLLQMCGNMSEFAKILYVSGEESAHQIKLRAKRLGINAENIMIANETGTERVIAAIEELKPQLVVIDSIQTMSCESASSLAGSITQVRECSSLFMQTAKSEEIPIFIVGHINKDGVLAGPKVMEHIVDAVLYFEGDRYLSYRILRSAKNRFGSTNEIGIFEMTNAGLSGVENPSVMLLEGRNTEVAGSCVTCVMEGTRPILSEIQSLATKTGFASPRRTASGFDYNRTNLLLAVLEKRAGYFFSALDVYINVVGGLQMSEPGVDLAVAVSLVSSVTDKPLPSGTIVFGEIGLGGEVRGVSGAQERIIEAARLGFSACVFPKGNYDKLTSKTLGIELIPISNVRQIADCFKSVKDK